MMIINIVNSEKIVANLNNKRYIHPVFHNLSIQTLNGKNSHITTE